MQKLQNHGGSGIVTIPKDDLARDGLLEDGSIPDSQMADVHRADERTYIVRFPQDGELPEIIESDLVERLVAQRMFQLDQQDQNPTTSSRRV
jgi:hypothetical protein